VVDAGVPPVALADWQDGETLVADGAGGLVRPEAPVPVEQLVFRGASAGVKLGGDGVILWEPRPGGRESGCQPVDRGWPECALTDLENRPPGRCATVDGLFDTPGPQPRPWRLPGAADRFSPRQLIDFVQLLNPDFGAISADSLPFQLGENFVALRGPEHDRFYVIPGRKEKSFIAHARKQGPRAGQLLKSRLERWQQAPEQALAPDPNAPAVELQAGQAPRSRYRHAHRPPRPGQ
jgi:hypothetical protein